MMGNILSFDPNVHLILHHIGQSIEKMNFQYLMIWVGFMIVAMMMMILSRISSVSSSPVIERIVTVPKNEITLVEEKKNFIDTTFDDLKSKVMIDHTKCLRELHAASERCYIKKNTLKCIQIVSYCPHLVNVKNGKSGMTPFHNVCIHANSCLVSYMLDRGANPWLTTDAGETALCLAIQACIKNPKLPLTSIEYLQKYGCYLDHTNKWYRIYLESALLTNNQSLARWMFDQASLLGKKCVSLPLTRV